MSRDDSLTGNERLFEDDELIVSKTDLKGRVTYCNDVFLRLSDYNEEEMLGQPHSITGTRTCRDVSLSCYGRRSKAAMKYSHMSSIDPGTGIIIGSTRT